MLTTAMSCSADGNAGATDAPLRRRLSWIQASTGGMSEPAPRRNGLGGTGGRAGSTVVGTPEDLADIYARAATIVGSASRRRHQPERAHLWYAASNARIWGRLDSTAACLATHGGGCDAARVCAGWEYAISTEPCAAGCSGTTFTACDDSFRMRIDCSKLGLSCDLLAICSENLATGCDRESFVNTCGASGQPTICDDDVIIAGPDCAALGLGCLDGSCIGSGAACMGGSRSNEGAVFYDGMSCEGTTLVSCVYGREHRLDCATVAAGFSCQTHAGASFCGIGAECTPAAPAEGSGPEETCEGNSVVFCNAGRVERIECTSLGFETCDATNSAVCSPTFADGPT